jgi:2-amino-4-hydroxy-6-hydroxymethyldihydropteridine diphosphokinase
MAFELVLSLGSNIDPRKKFLRDCIHLLNKQFKLVHLSSLYETEPIDDLDQDYFFNLCAVYETDIKDAFAILKMIKDIELQLGRVKLKERPKGPREIDIDILFFDKQSIQSSILTIPHREVFKRNFVLTPLLEILHSDSEYFKNIDLESCLRETRDQKVCKIGEL